MNAVPMIRECHRRQWPEDYGEPAVPLPMFPLERRPDETPPIFAGLFVTEWCDRCGISHGPTDEPVAYG